MSLSLCYTVILCVTFQLVYKVKLDFVLEQLASASVGGYGQAVWSELVEEARSNLTKIAVCLCGVMMMLMFLQT